MRYFLSISCCLSIFMCACGTRPESTLTTQERTALEEINQGFTEAKHDTEEKKKIENQQRIDEKLKCINQSLGQESFMSVLEDNQKLIIHFAGLYKLLSQKSDSMNSLYQKSQYLIEFNQVLYQQLNKVEKLSKNCTIETFNFIDYRTKITNSLMMVLDKYR